MAKTIKFNLICDDKPVRTIEDLQNNFSIEDVLSYYNNKLLQRWLEVRGYTEELEKVNNITVEKPIQIVKELIKIFHVTCDDKKVEESVYMLEFLDERKELLSIYNKENYKVKKIIDDYETGYRQLVEGILENPNDVAKIKANIAEMVNNYPWIFELNHRGLFWNLTGKSTLAVMCLLMNEKSRSYFVPVTKKDENGTEYLDIKENLDKNQIYRVICSMIQSADFLVDMGENINSFAGITNGYWKDLEPKGKKYMIISMESGDFVRSAGVSGGDLGKDDILNKFVIVDGIDYKSNSATHQLLYMEV